MCSRHWGQVPHELQVRVWAAYRREYLGREYLDAVEAAIQAVTPRQAELFSEGKAENP